MKKVIKDMNLFTKDFRGRQKVSDEIQTSIALNKYELKIYIENNILCEKERKNNFG